MKPSRIEALVDAVFAIVMTLLVLDLKLPVADSLGRALWLLWPKFLTFVISFTIIGIYWTSHHIQFTKIVRSDLRHMRLNLAFLLTVCLLPFSTSLLGAFPLARPAQIFYGLNLIVAALVMYWGWHYAITDHHLVEPGSVSSELAYNARQKMLLPVGLYVVGIVCSFIDARLSLVLFALGPIIYFLPVTSRAWELIADPLGRANLNKDE